MSGQVVYCTLVSIGLGALAVSYAVYYGKRRKRSRNLPENPRWELVGTVRELSIYPLQSGAALLLGTAECNKYGLRAQGIGNRTLVLLDDQGKKAFAGVYPIMLGISSEIEKESTLILRSSARSVLRLDLHQLGQGKTVKTIQDKGFKMQLIECEKEHHEWFSNVILKRPVGLRLYLVQELQLEHNIWGTDKSEFNPLMIMNNKSVDDLNVRLGDAAAVHHLQFRGNILLQCNGNVQAYDEDHWTWLKIGDCILRHSGPCLRCILPNIDIRTCQRNRLFEPLRTLKMYRLIHDSKEPTMGAYFTVHKDGKVQVSDTVYALRD